MPGETQLAAFSKPCFSEIKWREDVLTGKAGEVSEGHCPQRDPPCQPSCCSDSLGGMWLPLWL